MIIRPKNENKAQIMKISKLLLGKETDEDNSFPKYDRNRALSHPKFHNTVKNHRVFGQSTFKLYLNVY